MIPRKLAVILILSVLLQVVSFLIKVELECDSEIFLVTH